eukprot:gene18610-23776_t
MFQSATGESSAALVAIVTPDDPLRLLCAPMRIIPRFALRCVVIACYFSLARLGLLVAAEPAAPFALRDGDRVALIGDTLIEREQVHGW